MMLTTRPIVIYDLPLPSDTVIVSPEFAIIRFPNNRTVDIGCLCYLNRKLPEIPNGKAGSRLVQIDSLNESRKEQVISLIHHISNSIQHSGKRVATIKNSVSRFLSFMGWADANGFEIHLIDTDIARLAVQSYARYISDSVMKNSMSLNKNFQTKARQTWIRKIIDGHQKPILSSCSAIRLLTTFITLTKTSKNPKDTVRTFINGASNL